jgi:hypothetical protein
MDFLEKNLEDIIYETESELLSGRGLSLYGKKYRQPRLGNYGTADIVFIRKSYKEDYSDIIPFIVVNILELKQSKIDHAAFLQAIRYCKGVKAYFEHRGVFNDIEIKFEITLIGREITKSEFCYLPDFMENIRIFTYQYDFNGISFKQHDGYKLSAEGF